MSTPKTATAEQLRKSPILVAVPGTDLVIECRCPDPIELIADGILPLEMFGDVMAQIVSVADANVLFDNRPELETSKTPGSIFEFMDRWACAAAVKPRIVLSEDEATADPAALWVYDVDRALINQIVAQTQRRIRSPRLKTAVQDFRLQRSAGAGVGQDGAAVREDPVRVIANG